MVRIVEQYKKNRSFVRTSGVSGPQFTLLQRSVAEIASFGPPKEINEADYIATESRGAPSGAEKRRQGEAFRRAGLINTGRSRNMYSRVNSSFKDTMSTMAGAIEKAVVDSENVMRELISDNHMSEEEKRQREARKSMEELRREREEREDREA